jgi:hypothetical protein
MQFLEKSKGAVETVGSFLKLFDGNRNDPFLNKKKL